jgi:hypothetical protein
MKTLILCAACLATPAYGVDMLPYYETQTVKVEKVSHVSKKKPRKVVKRKAAPKPATRVLAYEERPEDGKCYRPLTVVGSQWVGEGGAYESAVKAMKEAVRWSVGEAAMDPQNWKDVKRRCGMSSVGEVVGQTFHRCEITATPCRPGLVSGTVK